MYPKVYYVLEKWIINIFRVFLWQPKQDYGRDVAVILALIIYYSAHYSWRSSVWTRTQSFFRAMSSSQDLDLRLSTLSVGITSSIYKLESDSSAHVPLPRCLRYSVDWLLEVLLWQKIHDKNNTSCLYFLVEVFIKVMKVSVASLEESSALPCVYQRC